MNAPTPGVSLLPRSRKGSTSFLQRRYGYGEATKPVVQSRTLCSGHVSPPRGLQNGDAFGRRGRRVCLYVDTHYKEQIIENT
jgi:lipopolysaccharide/colanic/teichoic acid biosynthesis glycosyltransferase